MRALIMGVATAAAMQVPGSVGAQDRINRETSNQTSTLFEGGSGEDGQRLTASLPRSKCWPNLKTQRQNTDHPEHILRFRWKSRGEILGSTTSMTPAFLSRNLELDWMEDLSVARMLLLRSAGR